jgi:S1-C subfamily serine protease
MFDDDTCSLRYVNPPHDDASLDTPLRLLEELGGERVGATVRLGVSRGGNSSEVSVVVGERPQRTAGRRSCCR